MSRIGRKPVALPSGVTLTVTGNAVTVKGPKGELKYLHLPEVKIVLEGSEVRIEAAIQNPQTSARHGLTRQLIQNMVEGVSKGYEKQLELIGVGYKAQMKGKTLVLNLGFSHPINYALPEGIEVVQDEKNKNLLSIRGIDKQLVGQVAADIRTYRPPEPYKGKGIKYVGEQIRRKPGKAVVKAGAA